jgi:hypothetical protein
MQRRSQLISGAPVRSSLGGNVPTIQAILGKLKFGREHKILNLVARFALALPAAQKSAGRLKKLIRNF